MGGKKILILGGGYAGVAALKRLAARLNPREYDVTLVDRGGVHGIKTRYHELAAPNGVEFLLKFDLDRLTSLFNARAVKAGVTGIDFSKKQVETDGETLGYHKLIIALGSRENFFGVKGAGEFSATLQTYDAAISCSRRLEALLASNAERRRVIVAGAGILGIEMATQLRQYAGRKRCEIFIVEKMDRIMNNSQCTDAQRKYVLRYMGRRGIKVFNGAGVAEVRERSVLLDNGYDMETDLLIWTSGVKREDVGGVDPGSRFLVDQSLQCLQHPEVFGAGDFSTVDSDRQWANLFSAQRAIYHGDIAARNLARSEKGLELKIADYQPRGELVSLGDYDGVGIVAGIPVQGRIAAIMKKTNEARYLADLFSAAPAAFLSGRLGV